MTAVGPARALASDCQLRVGWALFEPFQIPNGDAPPAGLDMDILRAVAAEAGCAIREYRETPWPRLLPEIKSGRIDVIASASFTEERAAFGRYSKSYRAVKYAAVFHGDAPKPGGRISLAAALTGEPMIGIIRNAYFPPRIKKALAAAEPRGRVYHGLDYEKLLTLLEKERLDVVFAEVIDPRSAFRRIGANRAFQTMEIEGTQDRIHFLFSRKTTAPVVVERFNTAIDAFLKSGAFETLVERYQNR